ncbi:MAG: DUF2911 domain-containing protein [Vicingaceae bacterium]
MKALKWIIGILLFLGLAGYFGFQYMKSETKKISPEQTVKYNRTNLNMSVTYSRPYMKGRKIFGELVPYEEVWRTGANEPTTFTTDKKISFGEEMLEAGTYTIWVIPYTSQWTIILNSKVYSWGVGFDGEPSREPEFDVLKINVPVRDLEKPVEQFTIKFEYDVNLSFAWENTKVMVPILWGYE